MNISKSPYQFNEEYLTSIMPKAPRLRP